jgi:L-histidine N-alpha-methyltransferase
MTAQLTVDVHLPTDHRRVAMGRDAAAGLMTAPKSLPPIWFYDQRGSELFDEITRLPEYYLTRAERAILTAHAADIVGAAKPSTLVELGSGTSEKTRLLLDAMAAAGTLERFVPLDVSEETIRAAAADITAMYGIEVHAVVGDFHSHLGSIPRDGRRLVAFLGSTIGNLTQAERHRFFVDLDASIDYDDALLLGTDLVKEPARLLAAYDDEAGTTAAFNRNVLAVLNRELGGHFDPEAFVHVARWNADEQWIEMWLRSQVDQQVAIDDLGLTVSFAAGEEMLTEISAKFTAAQVAEELWAGGFVVDTTWTDPKGDFLLTLAHPYC